MRPHLAWVMAVLVVVPVVAAQEASDRNAGWTQAGGGPDRASAAWFDGPLDVLWNATLFGEDRHGRWGLSAPFALTPYGGVFFGMPGRERLDAHPVSECFAAQFQLAGGASAQLVRRWPCVEEPRVFGYIPAADAVLICDFASGGESRVVSLDARSLEPRWNWRPATSTGAGVGAVHGCDGAWDGSADEVVVAVGLAGGGIALAGLDTLDGRPNWASRIGADRNAVDVPEGMVPGVTIVDGITLTPHAIGVMVLDADGAGSLIVTDRAGNFLQQRDAATTMLRPVFRPQGSGNPVNVQASARWAVASGPLLATTIGDEIVVIDTGQMLTQASASKSTAFNGLVASADSMIWWQHTLILVGDSSIAALDPNDLTVRWSISTAWGLDHGLVVNGDRLVMLTSDIRGQGPEYDLTVHIYDLATGDTVRRFDLRFPNGGSVGGLLALPDGTGVLAWDSVGHLVMFGSAPASLVPGVGIDDRYPRPAAPVRITPTSGADGNPVRYVVSWGAGPLAIVEPGNDATHAYPQEGVYTIRVTAEYGDGRTATAVTSVDVGGTPPAQLTPLQTAFARDNQDTTWGVIGLAITLIGAFIAFGRVRRRRSIVQREVRAIDEAAEAAGGNPTRLRVAMEERRAHCHGLLLDHKLDETQFAVIERHIDAIRRGHRMDQVQGLMDVLPHGIVVAVEEALADGHITAVERRGVQALVDETTVLSDQQKRDVAALIDAWFAQDAGGGA